MKPKKRIFEIENHRHREPQFFPMPEHFPENNRIPFVPAMIKPIESIIPCEICHKCIPFNKFQLHITFHQEKERIPSGNNIQMNFGTIYQRNHSAMNIYRNDRNRINEEVPSHHFPMDLDLIPHERPFMRRNERIFNEGIGPVRNLEIPHRRIIFQNMRRPHEKKKNKRFREKDIEILFPIVKYEEVRGKLLDEELKKCSICLSAFVEAEDVRYLTCLHRFHKECIDHWLVKNVTCPLCKKDLIKLVELGEKISQ